MKKGISLIVLVITIIVMIILAGAIILTLNNNGIINKASEAVEDSNIAIVKELTQMAWAEAYAKAIAKGIRPDSDAMLEALRNGVYNTLEDNNISRDKYEIEVTLKGVDVVTGWIQEGLTVKNGDTELYVGDIFNYDAGVETYTGDWKVLGAENGELLIMSTEDVGTMQFGDPEHDYNWDLHYLDDGNKWQSDWLTAAQQLDAVCAIYGKGKNATGARSIRVEDIDKITGYDKTKYGTGTVFEYGNEVTYLNNGTSYPDYTSLNTQNGRLSMIHPATFQYYDGKKFVNAIFNEMENDEKITTLISDYYMYSYYSHVGNNKAYAMIFGEPMCTEEPGKYYERTCYENNYWLASSCVRTDTDQVKFIVRHVNDGDVAGEFIWTSSSIVNLSEKGIRAVVSLSSDATIK